MIYDKITNANTYSKYSDYLKKGFEWLVQTDLENINDGKHVIDGDKVFANVQSYYTKDNAPYEAHKKYIDIQYMISGTECIGIAEYSDCTISEQYNSEKDVEFLHCNTQEKDYILDKGYFYVFFPQDAHKPSLHNNGRQFVKKVIVKVAIN